MSTVLGFVRRSRAILVTAVVVAGCPHCGGDNPSSPPPPPPVDITLDLRPAVSGLTNPVYLTAPTNDSRLFIVEQAGVIRVFKNGSLLSTPFLDISSKVLSGGERGLLSMAFDPAYASNGRFYVYYTDASGNLTIERYTAASGSDVAGTTATPVLSIPHPTYSNHNGGLLMFGPDGMLYIGTGDGGGGGDPFGNGQSLTTLLAKLLRIDVHNLPYTIPASNPFAGQSGKRGEIWAYGLRNPWRYTFDQPTGRLIIADVGQDQYEEVDIVDATAAGVNYGWSVMEGLHCYNATSCSSAGMQAPVEEYSHTDGCSITGGFVYRGTAIPELAGYYFYSDYCSGWLRSLANSGGSTWVPKKWTTPNVGHVLSFGRDAAGELYVLSDNGTVYKIVKVG